MAGDNIGQKAKKVLVTGIGQCSSLGNGVQSFWSALLSAKSGLRTFHLEHGLRKVLAIGAPLHAVDVTTEDKMRWFLRSSLCEALHDAGFNGMSAIRGSAVVAGSNFGDHYQFLKHGDFFRSFRDIIEDQGFVGEFWGVSTACASGIGALGLASDLIKFGESDIVVICAYDFISPYNYLGLASLRALSSDTIRPFDRNRSGTVLGEGVAAFVLESETSAAARNVHSYGEILGYGISNDAHHFTAPEPSGMGMRIAMNQALCEAGLKTEKIDHVNAHGTGTRYNDHVETLSIHQIFGPKAVSVPITTVKTAIGHTMGAAGAFGCMATLLSLRDGMVPPILNFTESDPECDLDYVFHVSRAVPMRTAMCNSYGLWGCNASMVLGKSDKPRRQPVRKKVLKKNTVGVSIMGLGPVSSMGIGIDKFAAFWGEKIKSTGTSLPVEGFNIRNFVQLKTQCLDRVSGMALAASALALNDAGWAARTPDPRMGFVMGTAYGNMATLQQHHDDPNTSPLRFVHTFINASAGLTSQVLGLRGAHCILCSGPVAGLQAIRYAIHLLLSNKADRVICGGADSLLFWQNQLKSTAFGQYCLSEGAGMLALQRSNKLMGRRRIEITSIGIGSGNDADSLLFHHALHRALEGAKIDASSIGAVILASPLSKESADSERSALLRCNISSEKWIDLSARLGITGAAHGGLAMIAASHLLKEGKKSCVLVNGFSEKQCMSFVIRRVDDDQL